MEQSKQITVERMSPANASLAARAINAIKPLAERGGEDVAEEWMHEFLESDRNVLILAHQDGTPLGFALGYRLDRVDQARPMMLFYEIEVREDHRGKGIATAMVDRLKGICREQSVMKMWMITDESNVSAMKLYESTGGRRMTPPCELFSWEPEDFEVQGL